MEYPEHERGGPFSPAAWQWSSCIGIPKARNNTAMIA
jgi:hypothetical protein